MGVQDDSSSYDVPVVLRSTDLADGTKWIVNKTSSGAYKISAKTGGSGKALAVATENADKKGGLLLQRYYVNDDNYKDEWLIIRVPTIHVDIMYDNAYIARYPDAVARINRHYQKLKVRYWNEFNIDVEFDSPHNRPSYPDLNCDAPYDELCTHCPDEDCHNSGKDNNGIPVLESLHHKNYFNIIWRLPVPDITQQVNMTFIGHKTCERLEYGSGQFLSHDESSLTYGMMLTGTGVTMITCFVSEAKESATVMHEFGHLYGVVDHYTIRASVQNGNGSSSNYSDDCIYGWNKDSDEVVNNLPICDECKAIIENNTFRYYHQSNDSILRNGGNVRQ